ncbi:MAG: hypothetical protein U0704_11300 [Candidatus Eisenbacteria bacterium]
MIATLFASSLAALLAATSAGAAPAPPDTQAAASRPQRVVREFDPVTVVGGRRADRKSVEVVHAVTRENCGGCPWTGSWTRSGCRPAWS